MNLDEFVGKKVIATFDDGSKHIGYIYNDEEKSYMFKDFNKDFPTHYYTFFGYNKYHPNMIHIEELK